VEVEIKPVIPEVEEEENKSEPLMDEIPEGTELAEAENGVKTNMNAQQKKNFLTKSLLD